MQEEYIIIAYNVKLLRKSEGLTQEEFGKRYGSTKTKVWWYEHSKFKPPVDFIFRLCKHHKLTPKILQTVKPLFQFQNRC